VRVPQEQATRAPAVMKVRCAGAVRCVVSTRAIRKAVAVAAKKTQPEAGNRDSVRRTRRRGHPRACVDLLPARGHRRPCESRWSLEWSKLRPSCHLLR
jgi:hypothetical protein